MFFRSILRAFAEGHGSGQDSSHAGATAASATTSAIPRKAGPWSVPKP